LKDDITEAESLREILQETVKNYKEEVLEMNDELADLYLQFKTRFPTEYAQYKTFLELIFPKLVHDTSR